MTPRDSQLSPAGVVPSTAVARGVRVLVIGSNSLPDSMESHVLEALTNMGGTVEFFAVHQATQSFGRLAGRLLDKLTRALLREPERQAETRLLRVVERFSPQLTLVIQGGQVSPKTIALLRSRTRAPIVCWCQDALPSLGRQYLLGAGYDGVFLKDRYMQDLFSRMVRSTPFFYLPEACNPRVHRPVELTAADRERYGCDIMIAGTLYYYRQEILRELSDFDLKMWGSQFDWMLNRLGDRHMGREVILEEKSKAARAARIALNPLHYGETDGRNCRAFELAGCGAFQLVTAVPVVAEHFIPGVEIETFGNVSELIDKCRHYLQHPDEAAAIARRAGVRAHAEHTYEHRLGEILHVAGVL